ncbi:hypothetical protein F4810DRAFT_91097 [Camillea tinctor]|nr:hypothetical protein F4810DRAFT_91097 [Camillea tinctor]
MDANIFNSGRPSPMRQLAHLHSLLPKHGFEYKTDDQIVIFRSEIEELYISLQVACSYLGPRPVERRFTELFKKAFEMAPPSSRRTIDLGDAYGYRYNPAFEYAAKNTFWTIATGIDAGVVVQAMSYMCRARALFIKFTGYRTPYNVLEGRLAKAIDAFTGVKPAEIPHPVFQSMEPRLVETMIWRLRRGLRADWDQVSLISGFFSFFLSFFFRFIIQAIPYYLVVSVIAVAIVSKAVKKEAKPLKREIY